MVRLIWRSKLCPDQSFRLMELAVLQLEDSIRNEASALKLQGRSPLPQPHIPTALSELLSPSCRAVVVAPNTEEGCTFRGMDCIQYEIFNTVYNIGTIVNPEIMTGNFSRSSTPLVNPQQQIQSDNPMSINYMEQMPPGHLVGGQQAYNNNQKMFNPTQIVN